MSHIQAIYRRGVFEPLEPVDLPEEQRVQLNFDVAEKPSIEAWLADVAALHARFLSRHGPLPDSTPDIAADRMR